MRSSQQWERDKRVVFCLAVVYISVVALYGGERFLSRHQHLVTRVESEGREGSGYEELIYFNRVHVLRALEPITLRDFLTATLLMLSGACCMVTRYLLGRAVSNDDHRSLYLVISIAFFYLALDELVEIHNTIGLNLSYYLNPGQPLEYVAGRDLGSIIICAYAACALALFIARLRFFAANRLAFVLLAVGFVFQALAAVIDFFSARLNVLLAIFRPLSFLLYRDEFYEMTASFLYLSSFILYGRQSLRGRVRVAVIDPTQRTDG